MSDTKKDVPLVEVKIDIPPASSAAAPAAAPAATNSTATTTTTTSTTTSTPPKSEPLISTPPGDASTSSASTNPSDLCERCHKDAKGRAKVEYHEHLALLCAECDALAKDDKVLVKLKSVRQPPYVSQSQRLKRIESFVVEKPMEHEPERKKTRSRRKIVLEIRQISLSIRPRARRQAFAARECAIFHLGRRRLRARSVVPSERELVSQPIRRHLLRRRFHAARAQRLVVHHRPASEGEEKARRSANNNRLRVDGVWLHLARGADADRRRSIASRAIDRRQRNRILRAVHHHKGAAVDEAMTRSFE